MVDSFLVDPSLRLLAIACGIASLVLIAWLERRPKTWHLGIAAFGALYGTVHLAVPGAVGSLCVAFALAAAIGAVSKIKFRMLGFNLLAGDILYLFASAFRVLLRTYPGVMALALLVVGGLLGGAVMIVGSLDEPPTRLPSRLAIFAVTSAAFALLYHASGGAKLFRVRVLTANRAHLSAFLASFLGAGPSHRPEFSDIGETPLPLARPMPGSLRPGGPLPHIILILHESTFDPATYGLPVDPGFEAFFRPPGGLSGALLVDIFGGSTWQTEFTIYSGLSSRSFGADSRFVFHQFAGRLRHTFPGILTSLGYRTRMLSADPKGFINNDRFYSSIGFAEAEYPDTAAPPFDAERWTRDHHDDVVYDYALHRLASDFTEERPVFQSIMTLMNHGSHRRRLFPPRLHAELRQEAVERTGNEAYGEYVVRLAESVRAYRDFRSGLAEALAGRPAIIVRFGDHMPSFTESMTFPHMPQGGRHSTFYAFEAINCAIPAGTPAPPVLDAAFLSTLALEAAGLPLDAVSATRRTLMLACEGSYFDWSSPEKLGFHRTLVDDGVVDLL